VLTEEQYILGAMQWDPEDISPTLIMDFLVKTIIPTLFPSPQGKKKAPTHTHKKEGSDTHRTRRESSK